MCVTSFCTRGALDTWSRGGSTAALVDEPGIRTTQLEGGLQMALMSAYLVNTKNAAAFFNAIQGAKAPERFTTKFLKDLDFASSNDRLFIGVLKGLGFLDENGAPTERYFAFLDHSQSGRVLADALRDAYDELFALNKNAQKMTVDEVKGKLKSLTQGQKSENVVNWMANTFKTLTELADWSAPAVAPEQPAAEQPKVTSDVSASAASNASVLGSVARELQLQYNIQLILPESRDQAVYDALFSSLRRHLF
jgi:hypothetical protein